MKNKHSVDMTRGGIFRPIIMFAIPLMLTGMLQVFYSAADMIVVGRFMGKTAGKNALAAIGSTSSAINLFINMFIGLSSAACVIVARKFGAKNEKGVSRAVHTSIALSLTGGILMSIVGILFSYPLMELMGSPSEVINLSVLYMKIYFCGCPAMMLYNFGSSILRAIGDTKRPLYYLSAAGVINIILNLITVIIFKLGVAGVGIATVTSQVVSAFLVVRCLMRSTECYKLCIKQIRFFKSELIEILYLGIPAGIQGTVFPISNIIIQSSINSVGSIAMAGNAAAVAIEGIVYTAMNSFHHATLTFISQNYGAFNFGRIKKGFIAGCVSVFCTGIIFGGLMCLFPERLISLYSKVPEVIACGSTRIRYICSLYFLCGLMDVAMAGMRGLGASISPMIISIVGVCGLRSVIIFFGGPYKKLHDLITLYISYWYSWGITALVLIFGFALLLKKRRADCAAHNPEHA